jgi:hypothetical protein
MPGFVVVVTRHDRVTAPSRKRHSQKLLYPEHHEGRHAARKSGTPRSNRGEAKHDQRVQLQLSDER